ncbi:MAG: D-2-hydroxyacid dehydrogenase [Haloarculaceae archaeon]
MTRQPETVLLHTAASSHWVDSESLAASVTDRLPDLDLRVARTPAESRALVADAEVALAASLPEEVLAAAEGLRWVQALSAGVDFYDLDALREAGVLLTSAAGVHAEPMAEQTLGYLLLFERDVLRGVRQQEAGLWQRYEGGELRGKTLGIVGVGAVGSRVAELAGAFGMTVLGTKRDPSTAPDAVDEVWAPDGLHELLVRADYVVLACPLTDETRGLIGREELGIMDEESVLVNVARGPIVEEDALVEALQQGVVRGAALDVFGTEPLPAASPLWDLPNAVVTPHMSGSTPHKEHRLADLFATNLEAFRAGDEDAMENRVV